MANYKYFEYSTPRANMAFVLITCKGGCYRLEVYENGKIDGCYVFSSREKALVEMMSFCETEPQDFRQEKR